jgi:hypothetical protein
VKTKKTPRSPAARLRRAGSNLSLVCEGEVQAGWADDGILLLPVRGIGRVNISGRILPTRPLAELGHRPGIKRCSVSPALLTSGKNSASRVITVDFEILCRKASPTVAAAQLWTRCGGSTPSGVQFSCL